ncbi:MAG: Holliday junction resolvase RuvX [Clostridiales bacterium]|nr:Holliday junction resolvase RuvX [Clostridiales bacterium]
MRIMGLDVGDKRIGVAISDPFGWTAQGIKTVVRIEGRKSDIREIKKIINEYGVEKIIIGLPKNLNNTLGPQGEKVIQYSKELESSCGRPVEFFDERLSTVAVERVLIEADVSRKRRRTVIDKLAAQYILQSYLDCKCR